MELVNTPYQNMFQMKIYILMNCTLCQVQVFYVISLISAVYKVLVTQAKFECDADLQYQILLQLIL
jgi:hypothetical protein